MKFDVTVIGGGFAGVAAAISAAREGLSVMIAEKSNCFGGAAVNCLVNPFMPFKSGGKLMSGGIFSEILEQLNSLNGYDGNLNFDEEKLKLVLNRMIIKENIFPLFHAVLIGAKTEGNKISSVTLAYKTQKIEAEAEYFIDCTGDGDLAAAAGCDYTIGREKDGLCQPMTLCFRVGGVDKQLFRSELKEINRRYRQAKAEGKITNPREDVLVFDTMHSGVLHFNTTRIIKRNPTDVFDITKAEIEAREQVFEIFTFIKSFAKSFENAAVLSTASEIGVRESRMITGGHILCEEELLGCTKFEDGIAACSYDIDIHNPDGAGTSHHYFVPGEYYTIPYRCLCPTKAGNLLVAGRCISSTHEAQASYRIMPTVCAIGQAAGVGAAVAYKQGCDAADADIKTIRKILSESNAVID